jgi:hypothetical protein
MRQQTMTTRCPTHHSTEGKGKEARAHHSLRTSMTVTMGAMTVTVEAMVAKVGCVAISQHSSEERRRWEIHNYQLKLNNTNATYNNDYHNDNAM